jgi:ABC-2 type transport system ATP-binding protein
LLGDPDVLILDEPTVGLDPRQIVETRNVIRNLAGAHTVILSTHILPEVSMTCQRVIVINRGRIVADDTPENLQRRMQGADEIEVEVRGPAEAVTAALRSIPSVLTVQERRNGDEAHVFSVECEVGTDVRETIASTIVQRGWGLREMRPRSVSLEEIFVQLVTAEPTAN